MERKFFHKAKLATAIALVSTTTLLTGCLVDGNKSNTNSTTVQEDASRISITSKLGKLDVKFFNSTQVPDRFSSNRVCCSFTERCEPL